jgi:hypothetical protein
MDAPNPLADYFLKEERLIAWLLEFAEKRRKIEAFPNVRKCLDELRQAGADPDMVLTGIVLIYPGAVASTKRQFKALSARLTNLADRLERIYQEVEAVVSDPLTHSVFWRSILLEKDMNLTATEKRRGGARYLCNTFRVFVNFFRAEAKAFRELGRLYETTRTSDGLGPVLRYVKQSTGQFHDGCMADLLQAAHDALGVKANFSAEQLRKLRQRKFPDLIRKQILPEFADEFLGMPLGGLDKSGGEQ